MTDIEKQWPIRYGQYVPKISVEMYDEARSEILKVKELEEKNASWLIYATNGDNKVRVLEEKNAKLVELCEELMFEIIQHGCSEEFAESKTNQLTELKS